MPSSLGIMLLGLGNMMSGLGTMLAGHGHHAVWPATTLPGLGSKVSRLEAACTWAPCRLGWASCCLGTDTMLSSLGILLSELGTMMSGLDTLLCGHGHLAVWARTPCCVGWAP